MNADFYPKHETQLFQGNLSSEEVADYYDSWAERYDKEMVEVLKAPTMAAKTTISLYDPSARPSVKILDIGAGTGLIAIELRKNGFQHIDGLDPSKGMLEKAKEKNLYTNYICEFLTKDSLHDSNGMYDCVVSAAAICPGHIPAEALNDFVRLTKKGGFVVITMRSDWSDVPGYSDSIKSAIEQIEKAGKWKKMQEIPYNHYFQHEGTCYVFTVL